jgi:hypothetical protein
VAMAMVAVAMAVAMAVDVVTRVVNLGLCLSSRRHRKQRAALESRR